VISNATNVRSSLLIFISKPWKPVCLLFTTISHHRSIIWNKPNVLREEGKKKTGLTKVSFFVLDLLKDGSFYSNTEFTAIFGVD